MKLTIKQKKFCDYYIQLGNATEAAIKAGYSKRTAQQMGTENLLKPVIKTYIDEKLKEIEDKTIMTAEEVLKTLTSIARGETKEETIVVEGCGDGVSEARIMKKRVSAKEQVKALELIGKRYRMFADKVELTGPVPVVISGDDEIED